MRARVVGDCSQPILYANAQARMRVIPQRRPIDQAIELAWRQGWRVRWQAVRRRFNADAHSLAGAAAEWAAWRHDSGLPEATFIEWLDAPGEAPPGLRLPPGL